MNTSPANNPAIDRQNLKVLTFAEAEDEERRYWLAQKPLDRLRHVELLRVLNYGSKVIDQGLQRVLAVSERPRR